MMRRFSFPTISVEPDELAVTTFASAIALLKRFKHGEMPI
jgi:hypothetical protein